MDPSDAASGHGTVGVAIVSACGHPQWGLRTGARYNVRHNLSMCLTIVKIKRCLTFVRSEIGEKTKQP